MRLCFSCRHFQKFLQLHVSRQDVWGYVTSSNGNGKFLNSNQREKYPNNLELQVSTRNWNGKWGWRASKSNFLVGRDFMGTMTSTETTGNTWKQLKITIGLHQNFRNITLVLPKTVMEAQLTIWSFIGFFSICFKYTLVLRGQGQIVKFNFKNCQLSKRSCCRLHPCARPEREKAS